jgi:hypothetical protein
MTFLPPQYSVPESASGYMKFKKGTNRFRILSAAITGYEYWNVLNKPIRSQKQFDLMPNDIKLNDDGSYSQIKHFWAFVVWNYEENMVQILEITQATIQRAMKIKIDNRSGDAMGYDFIVTRTGDGLTTDYDIDTGKEEPVTSDAISELHAKKINLEALFDGSDPFNSKTSPEPQNEPSGYEKVKSLAEHLKAKTMPNVRQNEDVAPDIAEDAQRMENGEIDVDSLPF